MEPFSTKWSMSRIEQIDERLKGTIDPPRSQPRTLASSVHLAGILTQVFLGFRELMSRLHSRAHEAHECTNPRRVTQVGVSEDPERNV
jgi:hypothetical protein